MGVLIRPAFAIVALIASSIAAIPGVAPAPHGTVPAGAPTTAPTSSPTFVSAAGPCHPYWASVAAPDPAALNVLYSVSQTSPTDAWAVGERSDGPTHDTLIERWDGRTWSVVPSPDGPSSVNVLFGVWAIASDDAWAVGQYAENFPLIEHWDGNEWSVSTPPPITGWTFLNQVWAAASDDVWIVGMTSNNTPWQSLVLHWNGEKWKRVKSPNEPGANTYPFAIDGTGPDDVWIVGGAVLEALSMHWNGSRWKLIHTDPVEWDPNFYDLAALAPDDVWAGGTSGVYLDDTLVLRALRTGRSGRRFMRPARAPRERDPGVRRLFFDRRVGDGRLPAAAGRVEVQPHRALGWDLLDGLGRREEGARPCTARRPCRTAPPGPSATTIWGPVTGRPSSASARARRP